jgi:nitrate reductase molybdenum cofactor assembly chaperone NarJ/NarW
MSRAEAPVAAGCRAALASLAPLFSWPDAGWRGDLDAAMASVAEADTAAARRLAAFAEQSRALTGSELEVTYTATFDLAPSCSPYLGVHLFENDDQSRARLMIGLRSSYTAGGVDAGGELPDHVALALAYAPRFEGDVWPDLGRMVLAPAFERMEKALSDTSNPYRHLISAARLLSLAAASEGGDA